MMLIEMLKFSADHGCKTSRFLLDHGQPFDIGPDAFKGERMEQGLCYMNATHQAWQKAGLIYVEGYVCIHGVPIQHAWNIDAKGVLHDPTLVEEPRVRVSDYFGVAFGNRYLRRATLANGYYGLLDPYYARKTFTKLVSGKVKFQN